MIIEIQAKDVAQVLRTLERRRIEYKEVVPAPAVKVEAKLEPAKPKAKPEPKPKAKPKVKAKVKKK